MQIYISQPPPPPKKKKKPSERKNKTKRNKTKTYLEFHYYPYDTERISMYMSPYLLLILLRAIGDFIRILIFLFNTRKLVQVYQFTIRSLFQFFVKIF